MSKTAEEATFDWLNDMPREVITFGLAFPELAKRLTALLTTREVELRQQIDRDDHCLYSKPGVETCRTFTPMDPCGFCQRDELRAEVERLNRRLSFLNDIDEREESIDGR